MKFTLSWLKEHLETSATIKEITKTLTMRGFEVEAIIALNDFTVAQIREVAQHAEAAHLMVCQVETCSGLRQVVCGASNIRVGMKSPFARPGVLVPRSGKRVQEKIIHGIASSGMLCSAWELQTGEDASRVLELPAESPIGANALDVLEFDPVLDIAVTPNRADCLGVQGIARELAAAGLGVLRTPRAVPVQGAYVSPLTITRTAAVERACPLFVGRFIRGVQNGPSPIWLQQRLMAVGLRSVSALVDITNLLSIDAARPLHVFDADRLSGSLVIRFARNGETITLIDNKKYNLNEEILVLADNTGPQALSGLIGGASTACSDATVHVFLESALFDPTCIARAGRTLSIESEARHRFERGVDPAAVITGAERATRLILDLCGGEASTLVISGTEPRWQKTLDLRPERFFRLTGFHLPVAVMQHFLDSVGCTVVVGVGGLTVIPPSWRRDLEAEHNLIEEIVRLYGYHNVPAVPLPLPQRPIRFTPAQRRQSQVRRTLAARGMFETITLPFISSTKFAALFKDSGLHLTNPMSADLDTLRPSLLPNLILAARRNAAHGMPDSALFEIGPQFHGDTPGVQKLVVAGMRTGHARPRHWSNPSPRPVDVFDVKADVMAVLMIAGVHGEDLQIIRAVSRIPRWYHPGRSVALQLGQTVLGWFGAIHPRVLRALYIKNTLFCFEILLDALPPVKEILKRPLLKLSPFHPVVRDFSFVMDNAVAAEAVLNAARNADKTLIVAAQVFDLYDAFEEKRKALAISVTIQPNTHPLKDEEIEEISSRVIDAVFHATGATLRRPARN